MIIGTKVKSGRRSQIKKKWGKQFTLQKESNYTLVQKIDVMS